MRWHRLLIVNPTYARIEPMSGPSIGLMVAADSTASRLRLMSPVAEDTVPRGVFTFDRPDSTRLILRGRFDGRPIEAHLRRANNREFLLVERGFHWINETPFHR